MLKMLENSIDVFATIIIVAVIIIIPIKQEAL